jgi:HSP20 family protein
MARDAFRFLPLFLPGAQAARQAEWQPSVDLYRSRTGWLVKFDLAGVHPKDVEWSVSGNSLTVRGTRRDHLLEEGCRHYRMEITYSSFERRIEIPGDLTTAKISTEHLEGMLIVRVQWEEAGA